MSLLIVGSVAFDAIETPFGKTNKILGGAATYISLSASYFVRPVNLVGIVGNDFGEENIRLLQGHGIDTKGLEINPSGKTFFWSGRYHIDMNSRDTLTTELNVFADFDPKIPEIYKRADYVMLGNIVPGLQQKVLQQLSGRPKLIVLDTMNFWIQTALEDLKQTLKSVDVLTINDEEARLLSGEYSLVKSVRKILGMGPSYLIIKKGEHGALLFHGNQAFYAPALPLEEVFDPTGAGDSFAGGFIGYLAKTDNTAFENMKRAVIYGSVMASFCVEKFGPGRLTYLPARAIEERYQEFVDLVQFDIKL